MKVGIIVITYNISPEITILQIEAIRKFCKDDFTIEVFDNSSQIEAADAIRYHCQQLEVNYKKTFAVALSGSESHSFAANLSYQMVKDKYQIFAYIDHDLIPVQPFSIIEILGEKVMAGVGQHGTTYFWPGCLFFKKMDEIDFATNNTLGLDTGGELRLIIENYGIESCIFFDESYHQNSEFNNKLYGHYAMINNQMFMHFVNSSNWNHIEGNENRINSLLNIAREKINSYVD